MFFKKNVPGIWYLNHLGYLSGGFCRGLARGVCPDTLSSYGVECMEYE